MMKKVGHCTFPSKILCRNPVSLVNHYVPNIPNNLLSVPFGFEDKMLLFYATAEKCLVTVSKEMLIIILSVEMS